MTKLRLVSPETELRGALYCRFSTDDQEGSVERQINDLEKVAPRLRIKLNNQLYFSDHGQSATTLFDRPGLTRNLLDAAEKGLFDVVLVEHTDRLSRKQAESFWLWEQFKRLGIRVFTPNGEVDPLRLTFESYQNEQFSVMLSARVTSGQSKAIREGRIPHSLGYGYEDIKGQPGQKKLSDDEKNFVVRMFVEAASLKSPRQIAVDLTRDGIAAPKGGAWTFQTVAKILQNEIYIGIYVRHRVKRVRNYNTGKRDACAPTEELIRIEVPHLRIVDQDLWDAVQKVRQDRAHIYGKKGVERPTAVRRLHPFAGLFRCAECGDKMIICGSGRKGDRSIACSSAWWKQQCSNGKSYSLARLTKLATEKMHAHLTDPDFVNERAAERAKELSRLERDACVERDAARRELDRVELKIRKLTKLALNDEDEEIPQDVQDEHKSLRVQQRGLKQRIALLDAETTAPLLPSAVKALARDVETLHVMLLDNPDDPACRIALGNLMDRVLVHPTGYNKPYDVSLYARHAAYSGTLPLFPTIKDKKLVQNQAFARINIDNAILPSLSELVPNEPMIFLGRWSEDMGNRFKAA